MNLTPAEEYRDSNKCRTLPQLAVLSIDQIRQIQADALRWAAQKARGYSNVLNREILDQINQLDPVREKPFTSNDSASDVCNLCGEPIHREQRLGNWYWIHSKTDPRHVAVPKP